MPTGISLLPGEGSSGTGASSGWTVSSDGGISSSCGKGLYSLARSWTCASIG